MLLTISISWDIFKKKLILWSLQWTNIREIWLNPMKIRNLAPNKFHNSNFWNFKCPSYNFTSWWQCLVGMWLWFQMKRHSTQWRVTTSCASYKPSFSLMTKWRRLLNSWQRCLPARHDITWDGTILLWRHGLSAARHHNVTWCLSDASVVWCNVVISH